VRLDYSSLFNKDHLRHHHRDSQRQYLCGERLILSLYTSLGGPAGAYGAPLGDATASGNTYSQAFENGSIAYNAGDTVAVAHPNPRTPAISAFPTSGVPGSHLQLTVSDSRMAIRLRCR